jgi:hypothetical protein
MGLDYTGQVSNCFATGDINGTNYVGGIIGANAGIVSNCYNNSDVNGTSYVGGVVAVNVGTLSNSYNSGIVYGNKYVGGLTGSNNSAASSLILNSYNTGKVLGQSSPLLAGYAGGVTGWNVGRIINTFNTADINSRGYYVGGLAGESSGSVINSYNTGMSRGASVVGGLVGANDANILNSFNTGLVVWTYGNIAIGGVFGGAGSAAYISNLFWDINLSGRSSCYLNSSSVDSNLNCTPTDNNLLAYYGISGTTKLNSDSNWVSQDNNYPKLYWQ